MSIVLTGTKTVTKDAAPHLKAARLTTLLATPVEALTVQDLNDLRDALKRVPHGKEPGRTIGSLLT